MLLAELTNLAEEVLQEMPQEIEDLDWLDLEDHKRNTAAYHRLFGTEAKKDLETVWSSAKLYKYRSTFFTLDTKKRSITYYMSYMVGNNGNLGDYVWQSLVWRNGATPYTAGLPQSVFFNRLLPKFGCIITDSQQTWNGKRFWELRITDAFEKGLNIYYYDFGTHECTKVDNLEDFDDLRQENDIWGKTDQHQMKRMVITVKTLPLQRR